MKRAWYLRLDEPQVPNSAILVGDRSRVALLREQMSDTETLNEDRGLLTVVGTFKGERVIVVAFGMGAPIAAVVAHELIDLGVNRLLRLGTMMPLGATKLGDFVIASEALSRDGTSPSYQPGKHAFRAGSNITGDLQRAATSAGISTVVGKAMSVDGFYTEMMKLRLSDAFPVDELHDQYAAQGCVGLDMETAALFAVGATFGVEVGCCCLATVDGLTKEKMDDGLRKRGELMLATIGLNALAGGASS